MDTATLWYVSRATGAVTLLLFTATVVLGALTVGRVAGRTLSRAAVLRIHRSLSLTAIAFLAVHIVTAIADGYVDLDIRDVVVPFGSGFDPFWIGLGAVAVDLMIAIALTSWFRRHLPPRIWKVLHLSAYVMWPIAVLHGLGNSGGDGTDWWMLTLDVVCVGAVAAALIVRRRSAAHPDGQARRLGAALHEQETVLR